MSRQRPRALSSRVESTVALPWAQLVRRVVEEGVGEVAQRFGGLGPERQQRADAGQSFGHLDIRHGLNPYEKMAPESVRDAGSGPNREVCESECIVRAGPGQ